MSWLLTILNGLLCAVAGAVCAGYVANSCVEWYRVSTREGGAGYMVVFIGLLGAVVGLLIGLVAGRLLGAGGAARGFGGSLAIIVGLSGVAWVVARALGDVPPKLRGDSLYILAELKAPPGWKPSGRMKVDYSTLRLDSINSSNVRGSTGDGQILWERMREESGRLIIPARVSLFTTSGKRGLVFSLGGKEVASFLAPIPAHPDASLEQWSDWLPRVADSDPVAGGFRYRFRIQLLSDFYVEENRRSEEEREEHQKQLQALWDSTPLQVEGLQSGDVERVKLVLTSFQATKGVPNECVEPLRKTGHFIATRIRAYRESMNPQDPDIAAAAVLKSLFSDWSTAIERAMREKNAALPAEALDAIQKEASAASDLASDFRDMVSSCDYYRKQWSEGK